MNTDAASLTSSSAKEITDIDDPHWILWDNLARGLSYRIDGGVQSGSVVQEQKPTIDPKEGTPSPTAAHAPSSEIKRRRSLLPSTIGIPAD